MKVKGKVHKFGDNINTDEIIPAMYLVTTDPKELGKNCMTGIDPQFPGKAEAGDIIVGGKNFGCGSSREHAPLSIKGAGISCVIAESFARIFFRNAINIGLPILECPEAVSSIASGDRIEVDFDKGVIRKLSDGKEFKVTAFPVFMKELIDKGGLMSWVKMMNKKDYV